LGGSGSISTVADAEQIGTSRKVQIATVMTVTRKMPVMSHRCFLSTQR
jgi:hypothetical protein